MSDTPETDAAWAVESGNGLNEVKEISRKLERERDEARHKLELCMAANSDVARIAKERDEAREALKAFQPLEYHDCSFYKDIMGNCIICKNKETK
jgi:hypothetical protein